MAQPRTALAWLLREGSLILQAVCFLSGVPEQGCKAEACIPAAWGPADSTNMAEAAAGVLPSASALRALPSPMRRYWMWLVPRLRHDRHQRSS